MSWSMPGLKRLELRGDFAVPRPSLFGPALPSRYGSKFSAQPICASDESKGGDDPKGTGVVCLRQES